MWPSQDRMLKLRMNQDQTQDDQTKLVKGLNSTPYEERLELLDLTTFEERVRWGDLIETHKILKNHLDIGASQFFERTQDTKTRGHNLKLKKTRVKSKARSKFFSNRVVTAWNKLPKEVVMANSTNEFKNRLDRFRTRNDAILPIPSHPVTIKMWALNRLSLKQPTS